MAYISFRSIFLVSPLLFTAFIRISECQTCQCIAPDGSSLHCIGYDSRLQADSLDEAIASFPDLSMNGLDADDDDASDVGCTTEKCQDCRRDMRKRLTKIGLLEPDINDILSTQLDTNTTCTKYRFSVEQQQRKEEKLRELEEEDDSSSSSDDSGEKESRKLEKKSKRDKRSALFQHVDPNIQDPSVIGTRFTISCAYKGVSVDPTGTVSLCTSCWVWRRLPDNYRPQFINELVCDNSDDSCLSGYATCSVGHRTFDAVRNDSGVSTTVTLTAGSYCECRISTSSSLQSLVSGAGISGTYNPLNSTNTPL